MPISDDVDALVAAFRKGATADFLQGKTNGNWGVIFTVAPCSPAALERAGRQFTRSRADEIRHVRRAVLKQTDGHHTDSIVITELPSRRQFVVSLALNKPILPGRYLTDEALAALEAAFIPQTTVAR